MKNVGLLYACVVLIALSGVVCAQHSASSQNTTLSQIEDHYITDAEHAVLPLAEAMPEDKYSFAPTNGQFKGVRTFADMVKHVAVSNYGMASAILHQNMPIKLETQADLDAIKGKAEIVQFLKGSFDFLRKALGSINEQNQTELVQAPDSSKPLARLEVADRAITHCWNHYGQMIEYLRMSGIAPPGSH
ncbi:MAG TPA: DinB family protein [Candidatus Angelobacter sp.]